MDKILSYYHPNKPKLRHIGNSREMIKIIYNYCRKKTMPFTPIHSISHYRNREIIDKTVFREDGSKYMTCGYQDMNEYVRKYDRLGSILENSYYVNGIIQCNIKYHVYGKDIEYYRNGTIVDGRYIRHRHRSGIPSNISEYRNGELVGKLYNFDEDGYLTTIGKYKCGKLLYGKDYNYNPDNKFHIIHKYYSGNDTIYKKRIPGAPPKYNKFIM